MCLATKPEPKPRLGTSSPVDDALPLDAHQRSGIEGGKGWDGQGRVTSGGRQGFKRRRGSPDGVRRGCSELRYSHKTHLGKCVCDQTRSQASSTAQVRPQNASTKMCCATKPVPSWKSLLRFSRRKYPQSCAPRLNLGSSTPSRPLQHE